MFTGIVTDVGEVLSVQSLAEGLSRLKIVCSFPRASIVNGASIACNGVCLTVVEAGQEDRTWFCADAAAETMAITSVGTWRAGTRINLERPLKIGDELGGHIVAGHVDGIAEISARQDLPGMAKFTLRAPTALARYIASKGSVTLDGCSLTVNDVAQDTFTVLIIPHTLEVTTLGGWQVGSAVNLEVDLMARYAARLVETR